MIRVISKRNSLCGKVNNVLCYFNKCVPNFRFWNWNSQDPTVVISMAMYYGTCLIMQLIPSVSLHGVRAEADSRPSGLYWFTFCCSSLWLVTFKEMNLHVVVHRLFLPACQAVTLSSRPYRGMVSISWECSPLLVGMLSSAVIVMVCHYTVFVQYAISCLVIVLS